MSFVFKEKENVCVFLYDKQTKRFTYKKIKPNIMEIGSKAFNLSFLSSLDYVNIPVWASIGSSVFQEVVRMTPCLQRDLDSLYSETEKYTYTDDKDSLTKNIFKMASTLRRKIEDLSLPKDIISSIDAVFNHISNKGTKPVAIRSSALTEDLPGASFAGLYDSYLNIRDYPSFLKALKMCWASTFNDRAIQYYMQKGISLRDAYMSVVVMELVSAEISGTAFTIDITTGYKGIHVMASNGLGGVVGGDVSADSFLLHPENLMILKKIRGSKEFRYDSKKNESGLEKVETFDSRGLYCLDVDKVKEVAVLVKKIANDYQALSLGPVDSEFAITKDGAIFFVQIRPIVMEKTKHLDDIDFDAIKDQKLLPMAIGKHSVFGVKHGRIKIVEDFHNLESGKIKINSDDIVVTTRTENQWTQYLSQFSGIISTEGNPTSHPVLISRERKVPCLVGVPDAIALFKEFDGQWVTLDGFRNCVYLGQLPLKKISLDKINELFEVVQEERLQEEENMIKDLFKKGFMVETDGKYWITGINSCFSGALLDMVKNSYKLREHVINNSGIEPRVSLQTEQMVVKNSDKSGKVYDHWWCSHEEQLKICQGMDLENCLNFYEDKERRMIELLLVCNESDLTLTSWKKIKDIYEELTAYQLLGFLERYPLIHSTYKLAKSLKIPRFFFEEYLTSVPDYEFEEDVEFLNVTKSLSAMLFDLATSSQKDIQETDLDFIRTRWPDYYKSLIAFSQRYKFSETEDWLEDPPVEKAFAKILEQIRENDFQVVKKKDISEADEEFFVDCPELRERIRLCIVKKIQQNNIHHIRKRAHWLLRSKLLVLGRLLAKKRLLDKPQDILSVPLVQLEQYINEHSDL